MIDAFVADGSIDNQGVAQALHTFLEQTQAKMDRGNTEAAKGSLNAFINYTNAQFGKHISPTAAQALIDAAQEVIDSL
jgi:hypothetical protein